MVAPEGKWSPPSGSRHEERIHSRLDLLAVAGVDCRMVGLGNHSLLSAGVGIGLVVHLVDWDRDLAGSDGSPLAVRAGRGCSRLGYVVESRRRVCFGVEVGNGFEKACRSRIGAEKMGIGRKLVAGSMIEVVGRKPMKAEGRTTGFGFAGRKREWRIGWVVDQGKMGFVDCTD